MEYRNIQVQLSTNAGAFAGQMGQAGAAVNQFGTQLQRAEAGFARAGQTMMSAGKMMTAAVTLPLAAIGAASVKAAIDFESSFAGVRKTVDATEAEFAQLEQGFRDLSKEIPINVNELNRIGEAAGQLGIEKENIISFTDTVAKMGVATNLASEEAANAFARIANVMGTSQTDFDRLGATIVDLGNNLATTESEIVEFGLRISGAGKIAGLAEAEVLAIGGAMASVGVQAAAGGTAVQKVLLDITKAVTTNSGSLQKYAEVAGMSAEEFGRAWKEDAAGAFTAFVEGLGTAGDEAIGILSELGLEDQRLIRSFLSLAGAGDLLRNSIELGNEAWAENSALTKEAEQRFATFASQWQLFKNQLNDVFISLGQALMPTLRSFVEFMGGKVVPTVEKMVNAFTSLPQGVQTTIIAFAGAAAAIGPVLIGLGMMATAISNLLPMFASMKAAALFIGPLSTNVRLAGPAFLAMAGSMTTAAGAAKALHLAMTGIVGAAVLLAIGKVVQGYVETKKALDDITKAANEVGDAFAKLPGGIDNINAEIDRHERKIDSLRSNYTDLSDLTNFLPWNQHKNFHNIKEEQAAIDGYRQSLEKLQEPTETIHREFAIMFDDMAKEAERGGHALRTVEEASIRAAAAAREQAESGKEVVMTQDAQNRALEKNASAHDSWASIVTENFANTTSAHDSWRAQAESNFAAATQSHDSWTTSLEAGATAHELWIERVQPAYESAMELARRLTAEIDAQTESTFEGLQLQGEALADFVSDFTDAYQTATSVVQAFATESEVSSQQIMEHYQEQLEAVTNWRDNLMLLAETIGQSGPGRALVQELATAGPEAAGLVQGFVDAVKDGNIEAILENKSAIDQLLNETLEDLNGRTDDFVAETGHWGEESARSFISKLEEGLASQNYGNILEPINTELDALNEREVAPVIGAEPTIFDVAYGRTRDALDILDAFNAVPTFDANQAPFDGRIASAMHWLDVLTGRVGKPVFDANPSPFDGKIQNALQALDMITSRTGFPTIDSHDGPFHSKAFGVHQALNDVGGRAVAPTINAVDNASGVIANIQRQLNFINRTYTAVVRAVDGKHDGGPIYHSGGSIGPVTTMHEGGLRPDERMIKAQTGEFVLKRSSVQSLGTDLLREMNLTGQIPWSRFIDARGGAQGSRAQADALRDQLSGLGDSIRTVVKERTGDTIIHIKAVPDLRQKDMGTTRLINEIKEALDGKMEAMK